MPFLRRLQSRLLLQRCPSARCLSLPSRAFSQSSRAATAPAPPRAQIVARCIRDSARPAGARMGARIGARIGDGPGRRTDAGRGKRCFHATAAARAGEVSVKKYNALSEATMEKLCEELEAMAEEDEGMDVEYSAGVLTVTIPSGTYVINKQPPNKQIWLSSPLSGPKRYDWDRERKEWVYARDGSTMSALLKTEVGVEWEIDPDVGEGD